MNQKHLILGAVVIIGLGGVVLLSGNSNEQSAESVVVTQTTPEASAVPATEAVTATPTEAPTPIVAGVYEEYAPEKLALAESEDVVLFFKASWCPSCRTLDADIKENLSSIPEGVNILAVDYDTATELKKKYGITTQHTLVQVDSEGTLLKKWSGGSTLDTVIDEIL